MAIALAVTGCSSMHPSVITNQVSNTPAESEYDGKPSTSTKAANDYRADLSRSGAHPVTFDAVEVINLLYLIDPENKTRSGWEQQKPARPWDELTLSEKYDLGFAQFAYQYAGSESKSRRNLVQNRLIMASERRCGRYVQYLKKEQADKNFAFGIATTFLSGLGALVPGMRAAQNLSGTSAVVSGVRAEYNNEYFANLAVSVITRGIAERRTAELQQLQQRQRQPYAQYDIAAAVGDAVRFDGLCNVVIGLEQANEAITKVAEPGQDAINRSLLRSQLTRALATGETKQLNELINSMGQLGVNTAPLLNNLVYPSSGPALAVDLARTQGMDVIAELPIALDPYSDALRVGVQIVADLKSLPDQVSATMAVLRPAPSVAAALQTASIAAITQFERAFNGSFGKDGGANSCLSEALAASQAIQSATVKVRQAMAEQRAGQADAAKVQLMQSELQAQYLFAQTFEEKLARYRRSVTATLQDALKALRESADISKLTDNNFPLARWEDVHATRISASWQCKAKAS